MSHRKAFTLIELLIVIAIIAVLISLFMVNYPKIDKELNNRICQSNLKSIHHTLMQYAENNNGWFPDCEAYYGLGFRRYYRNSNVDPPLNITPWDALSNVRQLKQLGASADTFFCPMSPEQDALATFWEKDRNSWTTFSTRPCWWCRNPSGVETAWTYVGYVLIFHRGWPYGASLADGRRPVLRNTCNDDDPLVADNLHCRANMYILGGWYHGGGANELNRSGSGLFNSSCNTLFAGGYVVYKEWEDLEALGPALTHGSAKDLWWFWLGRDQGQ